MCESPDLCLPGMGELRRRGATGERFVREAAEAHEVRSSTRLTRRG